MKDIEEFWLVRGSKFCEERNLPLLNHSREVVFGFILHRYEQFLISVLSLQIRQAIENKQSCTVRLLNYRYAPVRLCFDDGLC